MGTLWKAKYSPATTTRVVLRRKTLGWKERGEVYGLIAHDLYKSTCVLPLKTGPHLYIGTLRKRSAVTPDTT